MLIKAIMFAATIGTTLVFTAQSPTKAANLGDAQIAITYDVVDKSTGSGSTTITVDVRVRNRHTESIRNLEMSALAENPVTVLPRSAYLGDLTPGEALGYVVYITLDDGVEPNLTWKVSYELVDETIVTLIED